MDIVWLDYVGFAYLLLGMVSRAVIPFLLKVYKDELSFSDWDWKYLRTQLLGVLIVLVGLPLVLDKIGEVGLWGFREAWMTGYTIASVSRLAEKTRE